jgi:hypothetical protein
MVVRKMMIMMKMESNDPLYCFLPVQLNMSLVTEAWIYSLV